MIHSILQISSCLFQPRWLYYTEFTFTRTLVLGFILYSHHYMGRGSENESNPPPPSPPLKRCLLSDQLWFQFPIFQGKWMWVQMHRMNIEN